MQIREISKNKKDFYDILLIGDENISMIDKYLGEGILYALYDTNSLAAVCVVLKIDSDTLEIKNLATSPDFRNKGYASALIDFVSKKYKNEIRFIILGTGENDKILNFYKKRGFRETHRIKNFFTDNYKHPIFENGKQLIDMIYLKKLL